MLVVGQHLSTDLALLGLDNLSLFDQLDIPPHFGVGYLENTCVLQH